MERVAKMPTTSTLVMHKPSSPPLSAQPMEVGSSSMKIQITEAPMVFDFSHTNEKGKISVFVPMSIKSVPILDTIVGQSEIEEQPLLHQDETLFHQHSEPTLLEV